MTETVESRLAKHEIEIPVPPAVVGYYVPAIQVGNLVITSGQLPFVGKDIIFQGKVGEKLTEEEGTFAAKLCALNALAQIKACIGDLNRIRHIVRLEGYVQSAPGFEGQPFVLNGASKLLVDVLGDAGKHTRTAIGVSEMPLNAAVQIALWAEIE